jgi:hypothetical protein
MQDLLAFLLTLVTDPVLLIHLQLNQFQLIALIDLE